MYLLSTSETFSSPRFEPGYCAMNKLFGGLFGFSLCLFLGIIFDQVALGILAGLILGTLFSSRKSSRENSFDD
jgi:hypothetical protein